MDFKLNTKQSINNSIPQELIGYWRIGNRRYEFTNDSRYYVHDLDVPYELVDSGSVLVVAGTRYNRLYGNPAELTGIWLLEDDPTEEWNLRSDGTYTYHWPGFEYFGDYSFTESTMNTREMRAVIMESSGTIIFLITHQAQLLSLWWPHNGTL
ncbi:MAG: hypothetical protein RPU34_06670 [Candidatus Sedimenticola sp. (ex Thyasira tokunagai)]